jgi:RecA/RadA recombinase
MAALPFLDRFKKEVAKLDSVGVGIKTTEEWLSTGNYALNRALSGDFTKGIPLGKVSLFAGPSGSGKSFIAGNITKQAQVQGYHVVYLDSEHAIDVDYLRKIGVSVEPEHLTYLSVATIEDVNSILSEFFQNYIKTYGKDSKDAVKTLIVLDSLAMLSSGTEMDNYEKGGIIKGDQGQLAKRRKAMLRLAVGHLGRLPISLLLTDHVYPQDIMMGDGAWAITNSTKFSSSIIGIVTKLKLKEEGEVTGVRMKFETYKSRFAKLGTKVELEVPYNKGMASTSGLIELLEAMGVIAKGTQPGEKLNWVTDIDGEHISFRERDFSENIANKLLKHPLCIPVLARNAEPDIIDDDIEAITDADEAVVPVSKSRQDKTGETVLVHEKTAKNLQGGASSETVLVHEKTAKNKQADTGKSSETVLVHE